MFAGVWPVVPVISNPSHPPTPPGPAPLLPPQTSAWPIQRSLADRREGLQGAYDHLLQHGEEQLSARASSVIKAHGDAVDAASAALKAAQMAYDQAVADPVAEKHAAQAPLVARVERLLGGNLLEELADPPLENVEEALLTPDIQSLYDRAAAYEDTASDWRQMNAYLQSLARKYGTAST